MTLNEVYERWAVLKRMEVKRSTFATYALIFKNCLKPRFGSVNVEDIKKADMQAFVFEFIGAGRSVKTTKDTIIVLKMLLRFAVEDLQLPASVSFKLKYPTRDGTEKKLQTYTEAEQKKIIDAVLETPSPRSFGIMIALCTGMRIGELCGLRFEDIDFTSGVLHIRRTIERIYETDEDGKMKTMVIFSELKTVSSARDIPIIPKLKGILSNYLKVSRPDYYVLTIGPKPTEPRIFRNYYYSFMKNIGIESPIKFHGLRHTFATKMVSAGIDIKTISNILGHADISTTLNLYVHPSEEDKKAAVSKVFRKMF